MTRNLLVTGGAGFIGSNLVRHFVKKYTNYNIINLDLLTYASNYNYIKDLESYKNYDFIKADITNSSEIENLFVNNKIDSIIHLAAESHVDNSIDSPLIFGETNVIGTLNLLNIAKKYWDNNNQDNNVFYHVSTDEVYGTLGNDGLFKENHPYDPRSPYSASKASSDHFVRAFYHTYKLPIKISNCSNNFGPNQHQEKLIPVVINSIINNQEIPIYGDGSNIRDWLYVQDHTDAIDLIFHKGGVGDTYNIGGGNEINNNDLVNMLIKIIDNKLGREDESSKKLIKYVDDRKGHDFRYAIDFSKLTSDLGWTPKIDFIKALSETVEWYMNQINQ